MGQYLYLYTNSVDYHFANLIGLTLLNMLLGLRKFNFQPMPECTAPVLNRVPSLTGAKLMWKNDNYTKLKICFPSQQLTEYLLINSY